MTGQIFEVTINQIRQAQKRIQPCVRVTPLEESLFLSKKAGCRIFLKLENWQKTGSFKVRGALNKLLSLSEMEKRRGIITASAGNHGLGVAFAAQLLGIQGKLVVPENASSAKVTRLKHYNLHLIERGRDYDEAEEIARRIQCNEDLTFIHAFSDPEIIAGQGTIALEILEALPDCDTILVPIGGGGLISGVAIAAKSLRPQIKIIGIQSVASPAMFRALQAGKVVETPIDETIADGLAGRFVSEATLHLTQKYVDEMVLVSEAAIKEAVKLMIETEHILIEGSAAVGIAALLENKIKLAENTVIILTGRNISLKTLKQIL